MSQTHNEIGSQQWLVGNCNIQTIWSISNRIDMISDRMPNFLAW